MTTTAKIWEMVLADLAAMPDGATVYVDPEIPGLAWKNEEPDYWQSGPIGPDLEQYDMTRSDAYDLARELPQPGRA